MARTKKYFDTLRAAIVSRRIRESKGELFLDVYKMPKGSRRAGKFVVCTYMEYLYSY